MTPSSMASLFLFSLLLLLLPAQHGASTHASYKLGSRQVFFKTPGSSRVPTATSCSSIATGLGNKKLPVVHRQSPCSPLHGLPSLTAADVLRRDSSSIRRRFASRSSGVAAPAPALAPAPTSPLAPAPSPSPTIVVNGSSDSSTLPGELDYSVLVSYGTPEQQFPMLLDSSIGATMIRCKPCTSADCDPAFDPSRSSTFTNILCGSPDCPTTNCSAGSNCPFDIPKLPIDGTFAKDVLKLTPSLAVDDFRFVCLHLGPPPGVPEAGFVDLTRNPNSLPSRLSSPPGAFSYCLPQSPGSPGFLSLGAANVREDRTVHAPLMSNGDPELAIMYFIDVVGMSLGGKDLPIPAGAFGGNASTSIDVGTSFTMMAPNVYTPLRDAFAKEMSQYNRSVPGFAGFDTCFNFTDLHELTVPLVRFKFGNGESLLIDDGVNMLYHDDPVAFPFTTVCLAFSTFDDDGGSGVSAKDGEDVISAVIGTYTLASTEVVYDVAGGKVGFVPSSC